MTVYDSMKYMAALSGVSVLSQDKDISLLLQKVNLWDSRKKKIRTLSGGMVRRLGIAQALLGNPKVLVADEPTSGLDPEERLRVYNLLGEFAEENIVILSTHIAGDIEATCTSVGVLEAGRMIFHGSVGELADLAKGKAESRDLPGLGPASSAPTVEDGYMALLNIADDREEGSDETVIYTGV